MGAWKLVDYPLEVEYGEKHYPLGQNATSIYSVLVTYTPENF
jgi:hypothetical protein